MLKNFIAIIAAVILSCLISSINITLCAQSNPNSYVEHHDNVTKERTKIVEGHNAVDLGLSVLWADHNIGGEKATDKGLHYQWGECETNLNSSENNSTTYNKSAKWLKKKNYIDDYKNLNHEHDVASKKWGDRWRMPTQQEFNELIEKCSWEWISSENSEGYKVTGPNGASIFLPAAGFYNSESYRIKHHPMGCYWSSSTNFNNKQNSTALIFSEYNYFIDGRVRYDCFSIRPVTK